MVVTENLSIDIIQMYVWEQDMMPFSVHYTWFDNAVVKTVSNFHSACTNDLYGYK